MSPTRRQAGCNGVSDIRGPFLFPPPDCMRRHQHERPNRDPAIPRRLGVHPPIGEAPPVTIQNKARSRIAVPEGGDFCTHKKKAKVKPMAKMGRPRKEIDLKTLGNLARIQATVEEAAAWFRVSKDTMKRRLRQERFRRAWEEGQERGRISLRRLQFRAAQKGNTAMLIWLGKVILGQREAEPVNPDAEAARGFVVVPGISEVYRDPPPEARQKDGGGREPSPS